ncbi:MAG TPA: hypothetical protein DEH78_07420 [Solibacterales bacterium]|nr:hypothetical protein [Bryobacterales bacterium]
MRDAAGNAVEFSVITNAGSKPRERMAVLIQSDLARVGIKLNVVTLDFPALVERIMKSLDYEACLLGLMNVELDPNSQMNVWLSTSAMHPWNPSQAKPETPWEAEIDRLMHAQAASADPKERKAAFDRVQRIVRDEAPVIYLVHKNVLTAVHPRVANAQPVILFPQSYWNAESLAVER